MTGGRASGAVPASSLDGLLRALGLGSDDLELPALAAPLGRVTGALRRGGCRTLGLLPATPDLGVAGIALQIGLSLARESGRRTALLDACGGWPGREGRAASSSRQAPDLGLDWLTDHLALIAPRDGRAAGTVRQALETFLWAPAPVVDHLVVDLGGLVQRGEHAEAMAALDATAVVARSGRTTSDQLLRAMEHVPPARSLGVLLVGG